MRMRPAALAALLALLAPLLARGEAEAPSREAAPAPAEGPSAAGGGDAAAPGALPPPPRQGGPTLVDALWGRRSVRQFDSRPVAREDLSFLLWAGSGLNRPAEGRRTAPSAWEAYAVTIYVTSRAGTVLYDPREHSLRPAGAAAGKDLRAEIPRAESTKKAPVVLVLVADFSRYPPQASANSRRYLAHADCGVIAQNVYLAAGARGLGTVLAADARPESQELLGLGPDQMALYVLPVGHPLEPPAAGEKGD